MKIVDLTHLIHENMPVFPGANSPELKKSGSYDDNGYVVTNINMDSHIGTHMDSPAHVIKGAQSLDRFDIDQFVGKAVVIDCREAGEGSKVTLDMLNKYGDKITDADFLLFNFGWHKKWGQEEYFGEFPVFDDDLIEYIVSSDLKGIGVDVISVDPIKDQNLTIHNKLFRKTNFVFIENLTNLEKCGDDVFMFFGLPLKFKDSDGAPIRAVAGAPIRAVACLDI